MFPNITEINIGIRICGILKLDTLRITRHAYKPTDTHEFTPKSEPNCVGKHGHCSRKENRRDAFTSRRLFWKVIYTVLSPRRSARPTIHERLSAPLPPPHPSSFRSLAQALAPRYSQGRRGTICHGHRRIAVGWSRVSALFAAAFQTSAVSLPLTRGVSTR